MSLNVCGFGAKKKSSHLIYGKLQGGNLLPWGLSIIQTCFLLRENCIDILATEGSVTDFVRDTAQLIPP